MDESAVRVVRHESELGSHELASRTPARALQPWVASYTGYLERSSTPFSRREVPSGVVPLIIGFGQELQVSGPFLHGRKPGVHDSFVAGLHDGYAVTEFAGTSSGVDVKLTPLGARMLLGVPMSELANRVVELDEVLGRDAVSLVERLRDAPGWEQRFAILDVFLARRLAETPPPTPAVAWAWRRLSETHGRIPVGELAAELQCSRGYLMRQFREHVGLPPKAVARILRFERTISLIERDGARRWAEIAQQCGYYDQAHLNRDFRELAGITPTQLVASRMPELGLSAA